MKAGDRIRVVKLLRGEDEYRRHYIGKIGEIIDRVKIYRSLHKKVIVNQVSFVGKTYREFFDDELEIIPDGT